MGGLLSIDILASAGRDPKYAMRHVTTITNAPANKIQVRISFFKTISLNNSSVHTQAYEINPLDTALAPY
jgi:hypothetical protein